MLKQTFPKHGVALKYHHIGLLLSGEPGIGKSDLALDLLHHGAQFICDDAPLFTVENNRLIARTAEAFAGKLFIRDIGIIDIETHFPNQTLCSTAIDLIIQLRKDKHSLSDTSITPIMESFCYHNITIPQVQLSFSQQRQCVQLIQLILKQLDFV